VRDVGGFTWETMLTEKHRVPELLEKAQAKGYRYIVIIRRQNEQDGTLSLHIFHPLGNSPDCK
jgi:hypothetical protein